MACFRARVFSRRSFRLAQQFVFMPPSWLNRIAAQGNPDPPSPLSPQPVRPRSPPVHCSTFTVQRSASVRPRSSPGLW